jgi:hypothetical protein
MDKDGDNRIDKEEMKNLLKGWIDEDEIPEGELTGSDLKWLLLGPPRADVDTTRNELYKLLGERKDAVEAWKTSTKKNHEIATDKIRIDALIDAEQRTSKVEEDEKTQGGGDIPKTREDFEKHAENELAEKRAAEKVTEEEADKEAERLRKEKAKKEAEEFQEARVENIAFRKMHMEGIRPSSDESAVDASQEAKPLESSSLSSLSQTSSQLRMEVSSRLNGEDDEKVKQIQKELAGLSLAELQEAHKKATIKAKSGDHDARQYENVCWRMLQNKQSASSKSLPAAAE